VVVLDHLSETEKRAYILADNKLAELSSFDDDLLRAELADLKDAEINLGGLGFSDDELRVLLADAEVPDAATPEEEPIPEPPAEPVTRAGDSWCIAGHRLICGDCRDRDVVQRLFAGRKANLVITSPPYAAQRDYDASSGFTPIPPEKYSDWFKAVADNIAAVLAPDGSYFLNIKEHADAGQRSLYVKDLLIAHVRQWGWWFIDELCWRKTDNGVPGGWGNRFKNAWEPVFHFTAPEARIKFRPTAVGHVSEDCFDYSPNNPRSTSGSGLLGTGARGAAAGSPGAEGNDGRFAGIARPSNVIEVKSESSQGSHSAPFPRALVEFFVKAFTDPGDIVFDPFTGSASSIAAAHVLGRVGYGIELSPAYCDVSLRRLMALTNEVPVLQETGQTFAEVAQSRGVPVDQALNPKQQDARCIRHNGPAPFYGSRKKAS
jgi:DNA modification methylase